MVFQPTLDSSLDIPLYRQLAEYFSKLIDSGILPPGERLPATRELAGLLGVNRTTISAAYETLHAAGRICGHVGRGSFVAERPMAKGPDWSSVVTPMLVARSRWQYHPPIAINFSASRPPEQLFPLDAFRRSCEEVLESERLGSILQLGSALGYEPLRQFLLAQARAQGTLGTDDDVLITNGCQQAMDLLRRVLIRPGARVAIEDPVYPGLRNLLLQGSADVVGLRAIEDLGRSHATVAMVTPNFQNPTGLSLSMEQRREALRAAQNAGIILVENDIYSALRYEGEPIPSIKQLDPEAGTALVGSFSKVAFPGLRLGWVIAPRALITALREAKQLTDLHSDQFSQAVMLRFAESGRLATHVQAMIVAGRERLGAALEAASQFFPEGSRWTRPQGGFNMWVTLSTEIDCGTLLDRAQSEGVAYLPGGVFTVNRPQHNAFRLSFGGSEPAQIRRGVEILGRIFRSEQEAMRGSIGEPVAALV